MEPVPDVAEQLRISYGSMPPARQTAVRDAIVLQVADLEIIRARRSANLLEVVLPSHERCTP